MPKEPDGPPPPLPEFVNIYPVISGLINRVDLLEKRIELLEKEIKLLKILNKKKNTLEL